MRSSSRAVFALTAAVCLGACASASEPEASSSAAVERAHDAGVRSDAGRGKDASAADDSAADASSRDAGDKSAGCVGTFGSAIGAVGFARFDGTVIAVVAPGNKTCPAPNSTHVVIEVEFAGAAYRMVVDVVDRSSPGGIHAHTVSRPLVGGPWSDGWHAAALDYAKTLGVHSGDFTVETTADAVAAITDALDVGARISVFATAIGEKDSAHLVHRNAANEDGAIVVGVDGAAPRWLLFSFAEQSF